MALGPVSRPLSHLGVQLWFCDAFSSPRGLSCLLWAPPEMRGPFTPASSTPPAEKRSPASQSQALGGAGS